MLCTSDVYTLIDYAAFVESMFLMWSVAGLLWLRYKEPNLHRPIKVCNSSSFIYRYMCMLLYKIIISSWLTFHFFVGIFVLPYCLPNDLWLPGIYAHLRSPIRSGCWSSNHRYRFLSVVIRFFKFQTNLTFQRYQESLPISLASIGKTNLIGWNLYLVWSFYITIISLTFVLINFQTHCRIRYVYSTKADHGCERRVKKKTLRNIL